MELFDSKTFWLGEIKWNHVIQRLNEASSTEQKISTGMEAHFCQNEKKDNINWLFKKYETVRKSKTFMT